MPIPDIGVLPAHTMDRFFCFLCLFAFSATLAGNAGCSRQFYRTKADAEVYSVIRQGNNDPRWKVQDYNIKPDSRSRMFDPYHPDREPMPCDDPAAHRKMHYVDGKKGSSKWHENGDTRHVENPCWRQYLLVNEKGEVPLNKEKAVELARLHAPEYQNQLEALYLAAMGVSQERFRYDVQFFGNGGLTYRVPGSGPPTLQNNAYLRAERMLATGGEWAVRLANEITWTLNGQGDWNMGASLINVSVMQPLLRGANRKVVLENLTQSERDFLAQLRNMVLFQQGHYTRIVTGTVPRNTGVSGSGGGFYRLLADQIQIQNQRQNIIGLEENLSRLSEMFEAGQVGNIAQVEEMRQSLLSNQSQLLAQINRYQSSVEAYIGSLGLPPDLQVSISDPLLEQFQLSSPTLTVLQEDVADLLAVIRQKEQPMPENLREKTKEIIRRAEGEIAVLEQDLEMLQKSMPARLESLKNLETFLADRIAGGERVDPSIYSTQYFEERIAKLRTEDVPRNDTRLRAAFTLLHLIVNTEEQELREIIRNHSFDPSMFEALKFFKLDKPVADVDGELDVRRQELDIVTRQLRALQAPGVQDPFNVVLPQPQQPVPPDGGQLTADDRRQIEATRQETRRIIEDLRRGDEYRDWVRRVYSAFQYELVSLSLMQTRARLDAMTLTPISVTHDEAFQIASENRLDWMNRRAHLTDSWRQIDIAADRMKGVFDLRFRGDIGTMDRRGIDFSADTGSLDVSVVWDSPLTRYNEMMDYRRRQIEYQRERRDYYTYVDTIQSDLRNVLRESQMGLINFEINRNSVLVGTIRVDVMQLQMEQPPARGARIDTSVADQLIRALEGLMRSQNEFLNSWVNYQTQRMLLDLYMGTMLLDEQGRWIEPNVASPQPFNSPRFNSPDAAPLPIPVPVIETQRISRPSLNRRYVL